MQDLNDKINNGGATAAGQLDASEWNQIPSEIQNVIEGLGIVLSGGDLNQLGKAIAGYVANGTFYTDSGAADAYVLSTVGLKQTPTAYVNGMEIRFLPGNTNTGASTVNVAGLGVKSLKFIDGTDMPAGFLIIGQEAACVYDGTDFIYTPRLTNKNYTDTKSGRKNLVENGRGRIKQYPDGVLSNSFVFGADRWAFQADGTVGAGTITTVTNATAGDTGNAHKLSGVTLTGLGKVRGRSRYRSLDSVNLKNRSAVVSAQVFHDVGSAIDYTITVNKADVLNDFSAVTQVAISSALSVSSGVDTEILLLIPDMGDVTNGIEIIIESDSGAVTTKNFEFTDIQCEPGVIKTDFEFRTIAQETDLAKWYFEEIMDRAAVLAAIKQRIETIQADGTLTASGTLRWSEKVAIPTVTFSAAASFDVTNVTGASIAATSISVVAPTRKTGLIAVGVAAGLVAGNATTVASLTTAASIQVDSEL